ncbi:MAG: beta-ketoacyl synthase N-terminal-like domain-containing protein, partial [Maribacter sp.]
MKEKISITAISSVSPLGNKAEEIWEAYQNRDHYLTLENFNESPTWVGSLPSSLQKQMEELASSNSKYQKLDNSVLYAIFAARRAVQKAGWKDGQDFGVNLGSSRGATQLFEKYHQEFLETGKASTLSSPTTTLGNISSWVAHDLGSNGPEISHSITCSTGLHSVLNGIAWLNSGMADKFLVGGSEAPLTDFTIAQMKVLKIYAAAQVEVSNTSVDSGLSYPCRALDLE